MATTKLRIYARLAAIVLASVGPATLAAQVSRPTPTSSGALDTARMTGMADHAMSGHMDAAMRKHMEMTPPRPATKADSVRALRVVSELKAAISRYADTSVAVADGYRMFLPQVKTQRVYHFTNNGRALLSAFRFNPEKPTSILYKRGTDGTLHLVGAMYTMPKNAKLSRLDDRVPLSIARWHKHVNWCLPKKADAARWSEMREGKPLFGPESSIATRAECDAVKGEFHENVFGWMLHANVFEGSDLASIFGDEH
jgi:hypothetical protein